MTAKKSKSLSLLTKSLIVGTSTGAMALTIGCAPTESTTMSYADAPHDKVPMHTATGVEIQISSYAEGELCKEALSTLSPSAAAALMTRYPNSRCIPYVWNALTPAAKAAIPASVVAGIGSDMMAQVQPTAAPTPAPPTAAPAPAAPRVDVERDRSRY